MRAAIVTTKHRPRLLFAVVAAVFCAGRCVAAAAPTIAISGVTVLDTVHARRLDARTVLIDAGRISAVGAANALAIPAGAVRIDGHGKFLVPGLVDLHVHLFNNASHRPPNEWAFALFVANGVTGVREMMTLPEELAQVARWRAAVESGSLVAPRVLAAGVPVRGRSEDDARRLVRDAARQGADFIKVFSEVPPPLWRAIIGEARARRIAVDGHVPAAVPLVQAAGAGQRTAEHLMQAYEACSSSERQVLAARAGLDGDAAVALRDRQEREVLQAFDASDCARAAAALAATRQVQVPTLVLPHAEANRTPGFAADPRWRFLRADEQARWRRILVDGAGDEDAGLAALRWQVSCRIVRALHAAGVPILAGTDTPMPLVYPGYSLHDELELLADCGLGNIELLRAATLAPARLLHLARVAGSVEAGKRADLVLLDADPLADIRNLRRIDAVVLAGRLLQRSDLDALLVAH